MKAPKKIYLFENPISEICDDRWLSKRSGDKDIEYIRTDAFIEKACQWIKDNHEDIYIRYLRGCNSDDEILLFKEYMKGE